jgi:hypothetical protein
MRQTPTKEELLGAVADFLETDLRAAITDKALAFRARIAANVLRSVALESVGEDAADRDELTSLRWVLGQAGDPPSDRKQLRRDLRKLNATLAEQLRQGALAGDDLENAGAHLRATLSSDLALINPRFDLSSDIESLGSAS